MTQNGDVKISDFGSRYVSSFPSCRLLHAEMSSRLDTNAHTSASDTRVRPAHFQMLHHQGQDLVFCLSKPPFLSAYLLKPSICLQQRGYFCRNVCGHDPIHVPGKAQRKCLRPCGRRVERRHDHARGTSQTRLPLLTLVLRPIITVVNQTAGL